MSKFGEELLESVKQMAAIERGEIEPARETVYDRRSKKVRVNIYLDKDIVEHFKKQAAAPSADAYQTQINRVLRAAVEGAATGQPDINTLADLIAQKVAARISKPRARRAARSKRATATTRSRKSPKRKSV
ncbi:MAG TPA: BrnA antitoxin family protein [Blastocatellia bacterium]|jgi:uncharacterized protein (DUF4415 family)|nr:BrnA antitoxin family protein [Blastocatellia bacterium]